jgi:squalene-hopene/tetraprenyl-beta-curcumene cyclase
MAAAAVGWAGCGDGRDGGPPAGRAVRALESAMRALVAAQDGDGAWRSRTYGALKDGLSLTPPVLKAVTFGPAVDGSEAARHRGATYLAGRVRADGSIDAGPFGMVYPVYSAAATVIVLTRVEVPGAPRARDGWLRELRGRQLTEALGWGPDDSCYGGWGDSATPPAQRAEGPPADADLSSTLFAVGALRIAGATADDPEVHKVLAFVRRCQNFADDGRDRDPAFDDGGFFFSPTDPVRNKAGVAGADRRGRERYPSYGSATADGLRALLRCGLSPDHPRVAAARDWLGRHFSPAHNPGTLEPAREAERDATYYYYAWSVAHAFRASGVDVVRDGGRAIPWAEELSREVIRRQRADGSWSNRSGASKEDDPLVATALAAGALGACLMAGLSSRGGGA